MKQLKKIYIIFYVAVGGILYSAFLIRPLYAKPNIHILRQPDILTSNEVTNYLDEMVPSDYKPSENSTVMNGTENSAFILLASFLARISRTTFSKNLARWTTIMWYYTTGHVVEVWESFLNYLSKKI